MVVLKYVWGCAFLMTGRGRSAVPVPELTFTQQSGQPGFANSRNYTQNGCDWLMRIGGKNLGRLSNLNSSKSWSCTKLKLKYCSQSMTTWWVHKIYIYESFREQAASRNENLWITLDRGENSTLLEQFWRISLYCMWLMTPLQSSLRRKV